jgi:hypothetical protein
MIKDKLFVHHYNIFSAQYYFDMDKDKNTIELNQKMDADLIYSIYHTFKVDFLDKTNN